MRPHGAVEALPDSRAGRGALSRVAVVSRREAAGGEAELAVVAHRREDGVERRVHGAGEVDL